jgi:hypothetical protein
LLKGRAQLFDTVVPLFDADRKVFRHRPPARPARSQTLLSRRFEGLKVGTEALNCAAKFAAKRKANKYASATRRKANISIDYARRRA